MRRITTDWTEGMIHPAYHLPIRRVLFAALMLIACSLLADQPPAQAHGYILRSIPQDQAVVSRAPSRIQIWFSESLEPRFSTLTLTNDKGEDIPLQDSGVVPNNPAQLAGRIPTTLPDGAYIVTMRIAFASDGHVITERMIFWVGQRTGTLSAAGATTASTQDAIPLEVVWRILTLIPLMVLFGVCVLYAGVLLPAWGNQRYTAGGLAPRVLARLTWLIGIMIGVALGGCVLALFQQSMSLFAADIGTILRNGSWAVALNGTQFGDTLKLRFALLILMAAIQGASLFLAPRQPILVTPLWGTNLMIGGLLLGTMSAGSHVAGSTLWPVQSVVVDWLHLLANSAWIGGLLALAVTLPVALAPLNPAERQAALLAVLRRFSMIGMLAVGLLIATGVYSAALFVYQPSDLTTTNYGRTLIGKVLLVVPLLLFGLYHHLSVTRGRLAGLAQRFRLSERVTTLLSSVRFESAIGVGVILIAALLTATPPPVPADARGNVEAPNQTLTVSGLQVKLSIDPGAAGPNTYEVTLLRDGQPITGAQVNLRLVHPALDKRSALVRLDDTGNGTYFGAGLDLERPGDWQALVDLAAANQGDVRAAFNWPVLSAAPDLNTRQPTPLNWLSALAVIGVLAVWMWPGTGKLRTVNIRREVVALAGMAVVITVVLVAVGAWFLNDAAVRTDKLRNPTPVVANPVLADQGSIAAGQQVYEARCAACHGPNGAGDGSQAAAPPPDLRRRLPTRRDEDLFKVIPHAGEAPLSDAERWNAINYLRSPVFALPAGTAQPTVQPTP
ncbi:MAG: FixH family protein [Anaerolineae bacterium]|nr:FixH family protein [Anaerolineae bacterium]